MNAQYRMCIFFMHWKEKKKKHKFLEFAKWYRGILIYLGLWFVQVLSSHNFVAFQHWLLLLCNTCKASLNSKIPRLETKGVEIWTNIASKKALDFGEESHSGFPSHSYLMYLPRCCLTYAGGLKITPGIPIIFADA